MRRTHGEGTVGPWAASTSSRNAFRARAWLRLPSGKRRLYGYGPTAKAARADLAEKLERAREAHPATDEITMKEFALRWMAYKKPSIKPATLFDYGDTLRLYVLPQIGDKPFARQTPLELQQLVSAVANAGKLRAADKVRGVLKMMYRQAVRWEMMDRNPAMALDPVARHPDKRHIWQNAETRKFLEVLRTGRGEQAVNKHVTPHMSWYYALFYTAISTGMRRGELVALRWSDITGNSVRVNRTYSQAGSIWLLGEPKTRHGKRTLPMSESLVRVLAEHRERLQKHKENTTFKWEENDLVFPSMTGHLLHPPNLGRRLHDYAAKANVRQVRFHDLRRIFATNFIRAGGSPKLLQKHLGHATADVAMEVYADVLEIDMRRAVFDLEEIATPPDTPKRPDEKLLKGNAAGVEK